MYEGRLTASFGIEIKNSAYDAIVVHGRAEKTVFGLGYGFQRIRSERS